ncbi:MAG TPA: glycine betaine ABC transporter substrate-binding protein [Gaiellaceae bacterium]|jgi:osmoprotectant transport system substrate-binding protein|nr:glycine betaine ABC transporter substrate-binding protein [Gaiellaceae bacterium]
MVRKHMRRAAKAAFAVSIGVALLIGLTAGVAAAGKSKASSSKPTITLGTKNFGEEYILGQLYGQALQAKGFTVNFKGSFGSSELANTAIQKNKMNFYPEYTGVIALDLAKAKNAPKSASGTYSVAQKYEQQHGLTLLKPTPFYDSDTFTMLTKTAHKLGVKTIADMKGKSFSYAGYPECETRITCILGFKKIYKLTHIKFVPIGTISVYTLLDQKKATAGDGFSTDPQQLQHSKYTALTDTKHVFGFQNVAPVVSQKLLSGSNGKLLASICNKVSSKLTLAAMQAMNKAYYVNKQTPKKIASQFLQANGLK